MTKGGALPKGFQKTNLREMVKDYTLQYTKKNGKIDFPWEVLLLTARN